MNYLKHGLSTSQSDEYREMARPLTPKSERRRSSYGSMLLSLQTSAGLCTKGIRCYRKDGHAGDCVPKD